jgi:ferrous-iron efflux pump FieF
MDSDLQQEIVDTIYGCDESILGVHRLRTRTLGPLMFVDFHLKLPHQLTIQQGHDLGERVRRDLENKFANIDIIMHLDPDTEKDDELWKPSYSRPTDA